MFVYKNNGVVYKSIITYKRKRRCFKTKLNRFALQRINPKKRLRFLRNFKWSK